MLDPATRFDLMESLRPPSGMRLDGAVGTTYTLDLDALMGISAAFATHGVREAADAGEGGLEPVALLDAVRRNADRIAVFCQAGAIKVPARSRPVFAWLEDSVVACAAPGGGVFHPKIWALRYVAPDGDEALRLLCLSRNLTFDRSWDVVLRLDSDLTATSVESPNGAPLAGFLRRLVGPDVAIGQVDTGKRQLVDRLAECAERAEFTVPEGFRSVRLWPMGVGGDSPPLGTAKDRVLACAPFLGAAMLDRLAPGDKPHVLVSRAEAMDELGGNALTRFGQTYVLKAEADLEEAPDEAAVQESLRGLHAKFFVFENRATARVLLGSPNATSAAFDTNVEFACELVGHKDQAGIEALLASEPGTVGLADLLSPYVPAADPVRTGADQHLELTLQRLAAQVAAAGWVARVEGEGGQMGLSLAMTNPTASLPAGLTAECRPITLQSLRALPMEITSATPLWFPCTPDAVTAFVAVILTLEDGDAHADTSFVVNAELIGAAADRKDRVLAALLADPARFIEYLLLLLGQPEDGVGEGGGTAFWRDAQAALARGDAAPPLLEVLVRAAARAPESLEHVASLVDGLRKTPEGRAALPADFDEVWDVVWGACQEMRES